MSIFFNKTVLITGHTGFKGSWLSAWLHNLGANIHGISDRRYKAPNHYQMLGNIFASETFFDISSLAETSELIQKLQPDFIFHLAAQAIVLDAVNNPYQTIKSNTLGTASLLTALINLKKKCNAVIITSDKCYENKEWLWGYKETDELGGKDPYSSSKSSAELIINSFNRTYFTDHEYVNLAIGRAGNVIGGGDWAEFRIVPDAVTQWAKNEEIILRNPISTRPWQHVLEPLSGYLYLAYFLENGLISSGECFNFGPSYVENYSVEQLICELSKHWPNSKYSRIKDISAGSKEAGLLKLNCEKSFNDLGWKSQYSFEYTAEITATWYYNHYVSKTESSLDFTFKQIEKYPLKLGL